MACQLCLEDKELIEKSHIIPKFMYQGLFDQKHKIKYVNLENLDTIKSLPDGLYEGNILCSNCDNKVLGRLENYVKIILYGGNPGKEKIPEFRMAQGNDGIKSVEISNINYTTTKLFLLSILWRSHISKLPFFKEINLGPYAEKIREMLWNNDAGEEDELEAAIVYLKHDSSRTFNSIVQPKHLRFNHNIIYIFYINGIMYHFNISPINKLSLFAKGCAKKTNTMSVAMLEGAIANNYFDQYMGKTIMKKSQ
jgi:hypothetical protein